jgi:hypothetical protein
VTRRRLRLRAAVLLAAGAYALHQLRYLTSYGPDAHEQLRNQGHAYMALLAPLLAIAMIAVLAEFAARIAGLRPAARGERPTRLVQLWALASACLLIAYAGQETLEGLLAEGHPAGFAALAGRGGWTVLPLAAAIGLVLALVARGAHGALELAAEPTPRVRFPRTAFPVVHRARARMAPLGIATGAATARAPPSAARP